MKPIAIGTVIVLVTSLLVLFKAPVAIENKVLEYCNSIGSETIKSTECGSVEFKWGLPNQLLIRDSTLVVHQKRGSFWQIEVDKIQASLSLKSIVAGAWILPEVAIESPRIRLIEITPLKSEQSEENSPFMLPDVRVGHVHVQNGKFTYIDRDRKGQRKDAEITAQAIRLDVKDLNIHDLQDRPLTVSLNGKIHDTDITIKILKKENSPLDQIKVLTQVSSSPLDIANSYAGPAAGMKLEGQLEKGQGISMINGPRQETILNIGYRQLAVEIEETEKRGPLKSLLGEIVYNIELCDDRKFTDSQLKTTSEKGTKSWVQFYLMGLLKTALRAACFEDPIST